MTYPSRVASGRGAAAGYAAPKPEERSTMATYRGKLKTRVRPGRIGAYHDDGFPTSLAGWAWMTAQAAIALGGIYILLVLVLSLPV